MSERRAWASLALVGTIAVLALSALFAGAGPTGAAGRSAPPAPGPHGDAVSPSATFALGYAGRSPGAISLNWTASTAGFFANYSIFYSTASDRGPRTYYTDIASETTTSLVVPGLAPGGTYFWNVTAYSTGFLGIGASTTYSTILNDTQPTVAYLTDSAVTSTSLNLSWTNNATYGGGIAFGSYAVEEVDDGATSLVKNVTPAATTTLPIAGLSSGSSYSFYVTTYDCVAGCGTGSPTYSATGSNVVNAGTAAALTASVAPTSSVTDTGLPTGFTCTPAGGTAPYTFAWNFVNGSSYVSGPGVQSHVYPAAATYTVTCEVTDHASHLVVTAPVTVTVHAAPKVSASASPLNVTAGDAVRFTCVGTPGTAPLSVGWTLGNGATLDGAAGADGANGSASYGAGGTYVAHCTVTDAVGASATTSVVVHVQARPSSPWFPTYLALVLGAVAGTIAAVVGLGRRKDEHASRSSALSRWLPPTGPAATVHGTKICPKCGASNVPLRRTCQACGTPLPRNPSP